MFVVLQMMSTAALSSQANPDQGRVVALIINLAPWGYEENEQTKGFYTELAKGLAQSYAANYKLKELELLIVPYSRARQYLNQIRNSFTIMTNTSDIKSHAYSASYLFDLDVIAIPKPGLEINSTRDLVSLNVLKVRGTSLAPKVRGQVLLETSNALAQLNMLFKNRADVIIGVPQDYTFAANKFICPAQLDQTRCLNIQRSKALLIRQAEVHVWVGKHNSNEFIEALGEAVFRFRLSEEYRQLATQIDQYR